MKKVITAMNDPYFNEKLRNTNKYEVIGKDIVYQEGIEEVLNTRKDIDLIILSDNLVGIEKITNVIEKIKKNKKSIEIIIFLKENDRDIENYLTTLKIHSIYPIEKKEEFLKKILHNNNYEIFDNIRNLRSEIYEKLKIENDPTNLHNINKNNNENTLKNANNEGLTKESNTNKVLNVRKNYVNHRYTKIDNKLNKSLKKSKNITSKHKCVKMVFFNNEKESQNLLKVVISLILKELKFNVLNLENNKNSLDKIDENEYDFMLLNDVDNYEYLKKYNNKNIFIYIIDSKYDFYRNIENIFKIIKK